MNVLALTRKEGDRIWLYHPESGLVIWVTVADIDRNKVRLAIDAPNSVKILRDELLPREERQDGK